MNLSTAEQTCLFLNKKAVSNHINFSITMFFLLLLNVEVTLLAKQIWTSDQTQEGAQKHDAAAASWSRRSILDKPVNLILNSIWKHK